MMSQMAIFFGVIHYEFRMQVRRLSLWIVFLLLALLISGTLGNGGGYFTYLITNSDHLPLLTLIVSWTNIMNNYFPILVGIFIADRLARDHHTKVAELLITTPGSLYGRLIGKYLGCTCATLLPILIFYCIGIGCMLYQNHDMFTIPLAVVTFAAIVLPGILFVSAFSVACPAILWVPLYQFLFVGYWFWGNLLPPRFGIPTLSNTIFTPKGGYISSGLFGGDIFQGRNSDAIHATPLQAVESLLLLLGTAVLVIAVLGWYVQWEQSRQ